MIKVKNYFKDINNTLTFVFLIIICAAGFIFRFRNLSYLSFWGDDGHTFIGTMSILKYGFPKLPSGNILWHGIFDYYLKALPVLIFGAKEFSFRIVSVLSGTGVIIVTYFIGKELANKFVGFLGASIIAFSTWYVQFSREARYYSDYQFFFMLSFLFFYLGFTKDRKPFRVLAAVFMVLTPLVHGVGMTLVFLFIALLFYKGKKFFKKEIIIPMLIVIFLDVLQVINQVFFWKVGRSFYAQGTGIRALIKAYLKIPDPFYFKIINIMFPKMYYVFMAGIIAFIIFAIFLSIRKKSTTEDLYLNENVVKWGPVRWPFNMFMIYLTFIIIAVFLSLGRMYSQQRYIYFLMPLFILGFSYVIYLVSFLAGKLIAKIIRRKSVKATCISITIVFIIAAILLVNGINPKESWDIAYKKHNEKVNVMYSISNSWNVHRDAATGGKYVAEHMQADDIVITVDIYNSPPYTGKINYWLWTGNLVSWAPYHNEGNKVIDDTYGVEVIRSLMAFVNILNENANKNIWVLTNQSLFTKEHIDSSIRKLLDSYSGNLVLTGRDDVSRLYYFPKIISGQRIMLENIFNPTIDNIIKMQAKDEIDFDFRSDSAQKYYIYGFSNVEKGVGTWAIGDTSIMFINPDDLSGDLEFNVTARPLDNKKERQKIAVFINGNKVSEFEFSVTDDFSQFGFKVSKQLLRSGTNDLVFKYKYSITPRELNISNDGRNLSVLFQKMNIKKIP
ncbi:MAG: glycosyltransferase family 39 protein [Actinobacteria bacterium]|nr:glycosyltransferase family 39 protein [Actinomycetota bacterium]